MPTQKISFLKGLDKDSDIRYLQNAYRDAYNVRITDYQNGNKLTIVNTKGTTEKEYTLPSGYNFVIGSFDDKVNKNVYYFVYNSSNNHSVLKYDYKIDAVSEVLTGSGLGFTEENKITSVTLLDNRFLIYTDNNKEPRQIDLDNLSKYGSPYTSSTGLLLDIAKSPQGFPCLAQYTTNTEKDYNNLRENFWQFRVAYIYKDGSRSPFSTISKLPLPSIDVIYTYPENQDTSLDNEIIVSVPVPNEDVAKVEVYSQGVNEDSSKGTNWFLFKTATRDEILNSTSINGDSEYGDLFFANDGIYTLADPLEVAQEQGIPLKSKALDIIHGNRLALANITEGFDLSNIDIKTSLQFSEEALVQTSSGGFSADYVDIDTGENIVITNAEFNITLEAAAVGGFIDPFYDEIRTITTAEAGDLISFSKTLKYSVYDKFDSPKSPILTKTIQIEYLVKTSDIGSTNAETDANVLKAIASAINSIDTRDDQYNTGGVIARYDSSSGFLRIYQGVNTTTGLNEYYSSTRIDGSSTISSVNIAQISSVPTIKRESIQEFGIVYYDNKGRRSTAITNSQLKKKAPTYGTDGLSGGDAGRVTATLEISHIPPSWATSYQIVATKNQSFERTFTFLGEVVDQGSTSPYNLDEWTLNLTNSSVNPYINFRTEYSDSSIVYSFTKGDSIRFIYDEIGGNIFNKSEPYEIIRYDSSEGTLVFKNTAGSTNPITSGTKYLFEIRTPKSTQSEKFFYEIGEAYEISGGYHQGNTQSQLSTQPAILDLDYGDVYLVNRQYYETKYGVSSTSRKVVFAESENYSDYYDSSVTSIGKGNIEDENFTEKNRATSIVYSQPYIPDTNVNGISTFYGTSLEQYATQYGSIQHIYSEGRRLFLFQENKIGQIGINEQFFLNGSQQTYQTATVLNPAQYYPAEYGIGTSPESFSIFGYRKYFVDTLRGSVVRLSQDGMTPISNQGVRGFINNLLSNKNSMLNSLTYNEAFDELVLSVAPTKIPVSDIGTIISKTPFTFSINKSVIPSISSSDTGYVYHDGVKSSFNIVGLTETTSTYNVTTDLAIPSATIFYIEIGSYNVITFSEEAGAWVSNWDYKPEWMEECGIGMVSFDSGKIYLHDSNSTRGQFYGTNYPAKVKVVANENPSYPKMYKTIQQESTTQWECPSITTESGQASNLVENDFQNIQNQWYAAFLFDSNTPNVVDPLFNGDPLRDSAMEIEMQNDSTSEEKLFSVGVNYIVSNLSNDE